LRIVTAVKIVSGPQAGTTLELKNELTIGREHTDIELNDPRISRRHAKIRLVDGGAEVEDLGSVNGTWVNDERVTTAVRVASGATVKVGETVLEIVDPPAQATVARPTPAAAAAGATVAAQVPAAAAKPAAAAPASKREVPASVGAFAPSRSKRRRGLATRTWFPPAASYGTGALSLVALVIYFASN
jgi:pSer/pThr/pTyr-binding forkhead associated (FHA) protein